MLLVWLRVFPLLFTSTLPLRHFDGDSPSKCINVWEPSIPIQAVQGFFLWNVYRKYLYLTFLCIVLVLVGANFQALFHIHKCKWIRYWIANSFNYYSNRTIGIVIWLSGFNTKPKNTSPNTNHFGNFSFEQSLKMPCQTLL